MENIIWKRDGKKGQVSSTVWKLDPVSLEKKFGGVGVRSETGTVGRDWCQSEVVEIGRNNPRRWARVQRPLEKRSRYRLNRNTLGWWALSFTQKSVKVKNGEVKVIEAAKRKDESFPREWSLAKTMYLASCCPCILTLHCESGTFTV